MAEPLEEDVLTSFFPAPPPFYKHFTPENQDRLKQFKEQHADSSNHGGSAPPQLSAAQLLHLPTELRYLIPPDPPAEDAEYRVFGEAAKARGVNEFHDTMTYISRMLGEENAKVANDWEYTQLYPSSESTDGESTWSSIDRQRYLLRFLRSILLSFVELLGFVALNPTSSAKDEKLKNILTLVTNMHALINEYRPHQARETLINLMEAQLERKKAELEGVKKMGEKVRAVLDGFKTEAPNGGGGESVGTQEKVGYDAEERRSGMQREMWRAMDEILGH